MCQRTLTESSAMVANCGLVRKGAGTAGDAILEEGFLVVVVVGGKGGESEWDELAGETGKRGNEREIRCITYARVYRRLVVMKHRKLYLAGTGEYAGDLLRLSTLVWIINTINPEKVV